MIVTKANEMTKLLDQLNLIFYINGLNGFWISDLPFSDRFIKIYNKLEHFIHLHIICFCGSIVASYFTQHDLPEKMKADRLMFGLVFCGSIVYYYVLMYHRAELKNILYYLTVVLKEHYNDTYLEREMIRKIKLFSIFLYLLVLLISGAYGLAAFYHVITAGENFITIVSAWPEIHDTSTSAGIMRVVFYLGWFPAGARISFTFTLLLTLMMTICYQFRNIQSYFYSLEHIFNDETLTQAEKEITYERAFKIGIQMHALTLWVNNEYKRVTTLIYAFEIILSFSMSLSEFLYLMGPVRNLSLLGQMSVVATMMGSLFSFGWFMWTGGDVTDEASKISEAIYSSGWENCYGQSSVRIRKLVVIAMKQAQEPVVYKAFGVLEMSYQTYVSIIKMPYTAISVFY